MEIATRGNGIMGIKMEKEYTFIQMKKNMKDNGRMTK
jgi:hypothetical protein